MALKNKTHDVDKTPALRRTPEQVAVQPSNEHERPTNPALLLKRAASAPAASLRPADILTLQPAIGNRAVGRFLANQSNAVLPRPSNPSNAIQRKTEEVEPLQAKLETDRRGENRTGLPDKLKAGIERLSGMTMGDVRVHYNSSAPARVQALAFTQGTDIHIGPNEERHLPHEAWHVVQQKQERVRPTTKLKGAAINDNPELEKEADVMGARARQMGVGGLSESKVGVAGSVEKNSSPSPFEGAAKPTGRLPIQRTLIVAGTTYNRPISQKNVELRDLLAAEGNGDEVREVLNYWATAGTSQTKPGPASRITFSNWKEAISNWKEAIDEAQEFISSGAWMMLSRLQMMSKKLDAGFDDSLAEVARETGDVSIAQDLLSYEVYKNRIFSTVEPSAALLMEAWATFEQWMARLYELKEMATDQEARAALKEKQGKEKAIEQQESQSFVDEIMKRGKKLGALRGSTTDFGKGPQSDLAYLEFQLMKTQRVLDYYNLDDEETIKSMEPRRVLTRKAEIQHLLALAQQGAYIQVGTMSVTAVLNQLKEHKFDKMVELVATYCAQHNIKTLGADGIGWFSDHVEFVQMKSSILPPLQEIKNETEYMKESRIPLHDMLIGAAKQLEGVVAKGESWNGEFTVRGEQSKRIIILIFSNPSALKISSNRYLQVVNEVLGGTPSPVYRGMSLIEHVEAVEIRLPDSQTLQFIKKEGKFEEPSNITTTTKPPTGETEATLFQ